VPAIDQRRQGLEVVVIKSLVQLGKIEALLTVRAEKPGLQAGEGQRQGDLMTAGALDTGGTWRAGWAKT
jgi:hypothetical protein